MPPQQTTPTPTLPNTHPHQRFVAQPTAGDLHPIFPLCHQKNNSSIGWSFMPTNWTPPTDPNNTTSPLYFPTAISPTKTSRTFANTPTASGMKPPTSMISSNTTPFHYLTSTPKPPLQTHHPFPVPLPPTEKLPTSTQVTQALSATSPFIATHFLQELREKRLDLGGIAETLHTKERTDIPSKTTHARAFHAPLINLLIQQLQSHSPAPAEGTALRALKNTTDELARAKQKLHNLGEPLTPVKSTSHASGPAAPPHPPTPPAPKPPVLSDVLHPPHPTLKDDVPDSWNNSDIQHWVTTFDPTVQEAANEVLRLLQTSKVTTQQLKEAATRYGLPLNRVNRLPIRSLQNLVSVGAAIGC